MRLRLPRAWLERDSAPLAPRPSDSNEQPKAVAVGALTLLRRSEVARHVGLATMIHMPQWLRDAYQALARTARDAELPTLARAVGVHPVHLSRTFRRFAGSTMTQLRKTLRLERATEAIVRSNRPIAQIASEHGFADQSHLTRALRNATGLTPASLRRKARAAAADRHVEVE
jgi:AraC family transcriptional regulator